MAMEYGTGQWESKRMRECRICGIEFSTSCRTAKYCPDCREKVKKDRSKKR